MSIEEIIEKISVGKHRDKVFIAREYSVADLINDLKDCLTPVHSRMDPAPKDRYYDTTLMDDEPTNIYDDVASTLGKHHGLRWLQEPNVHLAGETPHK